MFIIPLVIFLVVIAALIDIITRQDSQVKHLPKLAWVLLVVFLPLIGSIVWFAAGREYASLPSPGSFRSPRATTGSQPRRSDFGAYGQRDTEGELEALEREIEYNSKQAQIDRLEAQLGKRRGRPE